MDEAVAYVALHGHPDDLPARDWTPDPYLAIPGLLLFGIGAWLILRNRW